MKASEATKAQLIEFIAPFLGWTIEEDGQGAYTILAPYGRLHRSRTFDRGQCVYRLVEILDRREGHEQILTWLLPNFYLGVAFKVNAIPGSSEYTNEVTILNGDQPPYIACHKDRRMALLIAACMAYGFK